MLANVGFLEHALGIVSEKKEGETSTGELSWLKDKIRISCLASGFSVPKHHKDSSSCKREPVVYNRLFWREWVCPVRQIFAHHRVIKLYEALTPLLYVVTHSSILRSCQHKHLQDPGISP